MVDKVIEVAPGVTQDLWTFEETVPGPILHGKLGDKFIVTIFDTVFKEGAYNLRHDARASEAGHRKFGIIGPRSSVGIAFPEGTKLAMYSVGLAPTCLWLLSHLRVNYYGTGRFL